ncbi:hypothetical protein TIFTF001_005977 [Ficus carica]|uniref:Uncharacterized protein n=1 Tax=Ficus carica TaxID=3494 RepID=A0AA87ZL04_FICCA|nr:hypothetical protein TIFTF001_005977 [Ficus carica]
MDPIDAEVNDSVVVVGSVCQVSWSGLEKANLDGKHVVARGVGGSEREASSWISFA